MKWFPRIGWHELTPEEAIDFDLPQPARFRWRVLLAEIGDWGITICFQSRDYRDGYGPAA